MSVTARMIAEYAAAVGEDERQFSRGARAPEMFAAVYSAPAIRGVLLEALAGRGPLIHAAQELEWHAPVHAGDRIATRVRLEETAARAGYRSLCFCSISHNHERQLVSQARWTVLVPEGSA